MRRAAVIYHSALRQAGLFNSRSALAGMLAPAAAYVCAALCAEPAIAQEATPGTAATPEAAGGFMGAVDAFAKHPAAVAIVIGVALLFGALLGRIFAVGPAPAAARRSGQEDAAPMRPGRPPRMAARTAARGEAGMIFRSGDETAPPPVARGERAPRGEREAREGRLLFDYFQDRFDVPERSADAAIGYLEQVAKAVERVRRRAQSAEGALERALDKTAEAASAAAGGELAAGSTAMALKLAMDGVRTARPAMHTLRGRADQLFEAFAAETELDDTLRRLAGLHAAHADGSTVDPELVLEPWPHALLRAEALLTAYFPADGLWGELREGLAGAAAGLRRALREANVVVGHVRLLTPYRQVDGEVWEEALGQLGRLEPVRTALARVGGGELIVDCEAFGYVDRDRGSSGRARLIVDARRG